MTKRRDALKGFMEPVAMPTPAVDRPNRPKVSGALLAMGRSLEAMSQDAQAAAALREQIQAGDHIVELPADNIDPSDFRDRLTNGGQEEAAALQASIQSHGQLVPVLVRPHPTAAGRYQLAYGHRRVEALRALGRPVRAVVRPLSDVELVVAQGKENTERRDLSFIERALFALRLERHGVQRAAIVDALSTAKTTLSTMISTVERLPEDLIRAIGPAPRIGRNRWEALADAHEAAPEAWKTVIVSPIFHALETDARFEMVFRNLRAPKPAPSIETITTETGDVVARVSRGRRGVQFSLDPASPPGLTDFIIEQLPALYAEYQRRHGH